MAKGTVTMRRAATGETVELNGAQVTGITLDEMDDAAVLGAGPPPDGDLSITLRCTQVPGSFAEIVRILRRAKYRNMRESQRRTKNAKRLAFNRYLRAKGVRNKTVYRAQMSAAISLWARKKIVEYFGAQGPTSFDAEDFARCLFGKGA